MRPIRCLFGFHDEAHGQQPGKLWYGFVRSTCRRCGRVRNWFFP